MANAVRLAASALPSIRDPHLHARRARSRALRVFRRAHHVDMSRVHRRAGIAEHRRRTAEQVWIEQTRRSSRGGAVDDETTGSPFCTAWGPARGLPPNLGRPVTSVGTGRTHPRDPLVCVSLYAHCVSLYAHCCHRACNLCVIVCTPAIPSSRHAHDPVIPSYPRPPARCCCCLCVSVRRCIRYTMSIGQP